MSEESWPIEIAVTGGKILSDGRKQASFLWPEDRPLNVGFDVKFLLTPLTAAKQDKGGE